MSFTQLSRPEFSVGLGAGLLLGGSAMLLLAGTVPLPSGLPSPSALLVQGLENLSTFAAAALPWLRHTFVMVLGVALLLVLATMFVRPATKPAHEKIRTTPRFSGASATHTSRQHETAPPNPAPLPSPLLRHAEELLKQAYTVPNFGTTPFSGQQRVLSKLAENFVPEPQRTAAVSLALFRLRRPAAFA